jgi:hypothetical protein
LKQRSRNIKQMEALLFIIEADIHRLDQPMTILMGLSDLLLSKVDPDNFLTKDLVEIIQQIKQMDQIIKGLKHLINYHATSRTNE